MKTLYPITYYRSGLLRKWRWRIKANNGNIIGASTQGYFNRIDCESNANLVSQCLMEFEEREEFTHFVAYLNRFNKDIKKDGVVDEYLKWK